MDYANPRTVLNKLTMPQYLEENRNNPNYDDSINVNLDLSWSVKWDYNPYSFTTKYQGSTYWAPRSDTARLTDMADSQWSVTTKQFDTIYHTKGARNADYGTWQVAKLCPPQGCPRPPAPSIKRSQLWSKKETWTTNGNRVPAEGEDVHISSQMWVILDTSTPKLGNLKIEGKLTVKTDTNNPLTLKLQVMSITNWGTHRGLRSR